MTDSPKPVSARRRETQERLMDAAFEVCVEHGLSDASVEAICAAAGFSRGAFYSNFSSKEELFFALLTREYRRRTTDLESKVALVDDLLRARAGGISREEAAAFIREFFADTQFDAGWLVIEQEFLLIALRDPALAPEYLRYQAGFAADLSAVVAHIVERVGRRFVIPAEEALLLLSGIYERGQRMSVLAGDAQLADGADLSDRVADVLFALTAAVEG